jgi:Rhodopirellula transposase DDE domain
MIEFSQEDQYKVMHGALNERQWRLYVATEARRRGTGGISRVAREAGVTRKTIHKGLQELEAGELYEPGGRIRRKGGGRKQVTAKDKTLYADLEKLLEPKGDPQSLVQWTTKSMGKLKEGLGSQGHTIGETAIRELVKGMGFSLKANKKTIEGTVHADRDAQFQQINRTGKAFEAAGKPMISVDCKKKELIGNFKNNGREWQAKGQETTVNVYDYRSIADGKAVPYGIYDLVHNSGFVNVGIDHETAEFAVESIRRWWQNVGKPLYVTSKELLIFADGGGSNGARSRLWKMQLQQFATETGLSITVCHLPPATSKWNKIEHRLFSYISINWRGKPLTSFETVIELISQTTTKQGLTVTAVKDSNSYPTGIKVSDEDLAALNITREPFHGDWNYTIQPQALVPLFQ